MQIIDRVQFSPDERAAWLDRRARDPAAVLALACRRAELGEAEAQALRAVVDGRDDWTIAGVVRLVHQASLTLEGLGEACVEAGLGEAEAAALRLVVLGRRAWTSDAAMGRAGHAAATLAGLSEGDWPWLRPWIPPAEWDVPDTPGWTLSERAAELIRVEIGEQTEMHHGQVEEVPVWRHAGHAARPVRVPRYGREVDLWMAAHVADPAPGPEYLADLETGEVTRDAGKAMHLFPKYDRSWSDLEQNLSGGTGKAGVPTKAGAGVPVPIDPRLRKQDPAKKKGRAKRAGKGAGR